MKIEYSDYMDDMQKIVAFEYVKKLYMDGKISKRMMENIKSDIKNQIKLEKMKKLL